jgi:hypothetical protein
MKRGQVTIFIILGIVIVVGIVIVFILARGVDVESPTSLGPRDFVDKCVRDVVESSVEKILTNGGEIVPSHSLMYNGEEWNYLCYQADYYLSCYNIHPMLENLVESEIRLDTMDEVQNCFNMMAIDFEDRGYDVSGGAASYSIDLMPGEVDINLKKKIQITKGGALQSFENFDTSVLSSAYSLVRVAREIVNSEAQYCYFEYNGYMLLYPDYDIRRVDYDGSKMYNVINRRSGEDFKFAVRSCAFAPGI